MTNTYHFDRFNDVLSTIQQRIYPRTPWDVSKETKDPRRGKQEMKFPIDDRDITYDWYRAYLRVKVHAVKANRTTDADEETVALFPGTFSLVDKLSIDIGTQTIYSLASGTNPVIFLKKCLEMGKGFAETVGLNEKFVLDDGADLKASDTNEGFKKRSLTGDDNEILYIPLNNYGFFAAFQKTLLPPVSMTITLGMNDNTKCLLTKADETLIIRDVELFVPQVILKPDKTIEMLESLMTEKQIVFHQESIQSLPNLKTLGEITTKSSDGFRNPKHVFFWTYDSGKGGESRVDTKLPAYQFNTFMIPINGKFLGGISKYGADVYIPDFNGYGQDELDRIWNDVVDYARRRNRPNTSGVMFSYDEWVTNFGFIHFDFSRHERLAPEDTKTLVTTVKYVSGQATNDLQLNFGYIQEREIKLINTGGVVIVTKLM